MSDRTGYDSIGAVEPVSTVEGGAGKITVTARGNPGETVTIEVKNSSGTVVASTTGTLDENGEFTTTFSPLDAGSYTVVITNETTGYSSSTSATVT